MAIKFASPVRVKTARHARAPIPTSRRSDGGSSAISPTVGYRYQPDTRDVSDYRQVDRLEKLRSRSNPALMYSVHRADSLRYSVPLFPAYLVSLAPSSAALQVIRRATRQGNSGGSPAPRFLGLQPRVSIRSAL